MMGRPDARKIQEMMKKLNMNVTNVDAEEVIIKAKTKQIIISNPEIMIANMMGKDVYQITGKVSEKSNLNEDDIRLVMDKTGKDKKTVEEKLEELDNDLARAIVELKGNKQK